MRYSSASSNALSFEVSHQSDMLLKHRPTCIRPWYFESFASTARRLSSVRRGSSAERCSHSWARTLDGLLSTSSCEVRLLHNPNGIVYKNASPIAPVAAGHSYHLIATRSSTGSSSTVPNLLSIGSVACSIDSCFISSAESIADSSRCLEPFSQLIEG